MNQRILVVDDEEVIRFTFRTFLENERYEVVATDNYVSAVEEIESNDFDLIFADIILKGDSGIDILRKVKDMGLRCPVIMITGQPDIDNASESVRLGAFDYLPKPVKKDAILHAARLALAHKRLLDKKEVSDLKDRYRRGKVGDIEVKEKLVVVINQFLEPIRIRRVKFSKHLAIEKIVTEGSAIAQKEAQKTLQEVKKAMGLV